MLLDFLFKYPVSPQFNILFHESDLRRRSAEVSMQPLPTNTKFAKMPPARPSGDAGKCCGIPNSMSIAFYSKKDGLNARKTLLERTHLSSIVGLGFDSSPYSQRSAGGGAHSVPLEQRLHRTPHNLESEGTDGAG